MSPEGLPESFDEIPEYMAQYDALLWEGLITVADYDEVASRVLTHLYGPGAAQRDREFAEAMSPNTKPSSRKKNVCWATDGF